MAPNPALLALEAVYILLAGSSGTAALGRVLLVEEVVQILLAIRKMQ